MTTLRAFSLTELETLDFPPVSWLVEDLLPQGALALLAGQPKAGKSLLGLDLVASVARGESFLGRASVQGVTLLVPAEDHIALVRERLLERLEDDAGVPILVAPADGALGQRLRLDDSDSFGELEALIAEHRPTLVVLDPLRELHGQGENDSDEMAPLIGRLRELAHRTGTTIVLIHHANKHGSDIRAVRGSTAIVGSVDLVLLADRPSEEMALAPDPMITITVEGRYGPRQRIAARLGPRLRWLASEGPDGRRDAPAADRIPQHLATHGAALTASELAEALGIRVHAVQNAVTALVKAGVLDREGAGTKNAPYRYRLPSSVVDAHVPNDDGREFGARTNSLAPDRGDDEPGKRSWMIPPAWKPIHPSWEESSLRAATRRTRG